MAQALHTTETTYSRDDMRNKLLASAEAMVPALRSRAQETARLGKLPQLTIDEMQAAGFFKILQPLRHGGLELAPKDFFDVQIKLAEGCMSAAWVLGVVAIHNWQLALYPEQAQRDVWGKDASTLISSSYMPVGKVVPTDGGYQLSGHWSFSSGSKHCDWVFVGAMVPPGEPGEAPDYRTFLVPRSDYTIVDNWNVSGLEGTGSNDIVIENKFVPEHRTHRALDGFACQSPGNALNSAPLYHIPFGQIFVRAVSSSSIGALQSALDAFVKINRDRVGLNDGEKVSLDPGAQLSVARARATIDECKTIMYKNFDIMLEHAASGEQVDLDQRLKMRFDAAQVAPRCAEAVNELYVFSGAQGIYRDHPINRAWLDINAGRNHVANNIGKIGRNLGGTMMGLENDDTFL